MTLAASTLGKTRPELIAGFLEEAAPPPEWLELLLRHIQNNGQIQGGTPIVCIRAVDRDEGKDILVIKANEVDLPGPGCTRWHDLTFPIGKILAERIGKEMDERRLTFVPGDWMALYNFGVGSETSDFK